MALQPPDLREAALSAREYAKLVVTARGGDRRRVCWPVAAVRLPVVAAVIVGGPRQAFSLVVEEAVAAGLEGESAVGTLVVLVTVVLLRVQLQSLWLGTGDVRDELSCRWSLALGRRGRQAYRGLGLRWGWSWRGWQRRELSHAGWTLSYHFPPSGAEVILQINMTFILGEWFDQGESPGTK